MPFIKVALITILINIAVLYTVFIIVMPSLHCHWDSITCHTVDNN